MKTLIILTATEDRLEFIPNIRADIALYVGEINLEDDDIAPANAMCFNGKLSVKAKKHIVEQIQDEYDNDINAVFLEFEGEKADCPDDYSFTIKTK